MKKMPELIYEIKNCDKGWDDGGNTLVYKKMVPGRTCGAFAFRKVVESETNARVKKNWWAVDSVMLGRNVGYYRLQKSAWAVAEEYSKCVRADNADLFKICTAIRDFEDGDLYRWSRECSTLRLGFISYSEYKKDPNLNFITKAAPKK